MLPWLAVSLFTLNDFFHFLNFLAEMVPMDQNRDQPTGILGDTKHTFNSMKGVVSWKILFSIK
jgi:hypothetical protein